MISLVGTWMQTVAQAWLVYRLTGSAVLLVDCQTPSLRVTSPRPMLPLQLPSAAPLQAVADEGAPPTRSARA